uniref:AlNc14C6G899 protein n=1 Tax=Albugo laibachii Nc14 TaxID=890382 RepID=F0W1D0_9STRA|nr:AlNc14C6G899 [Albugo laibachii Nc14]|eukprot:CCA14858.1 AlNc14C6G899 [Albugo laibachii Nc14]
MKDLLKTAAAIQLGIFAAYQHLVGAEYMNVISTSRDKHNNISPGGLRVQIEPSLEFSNDGGLITSINNNDLYTVRLLIEGGEEVKAVSFVRSCYETIAEHSVGLLRKLGCLPIPDFGSDHPNVQRTTASAASEHSGVLRGGDEHVGSSVMANDAQEIHHADGRSCGTTNQADIPISFLHRWLENIREDLVGVESYGCASLSKASVMDTMTYMKKNEGIYSFEKTKDGCKLHFKSLKEGKHDFTSTSNEWTLQLKFDTYEMPSVKVRLDFSEEAIRVPKKMYQELTENLLVLGFHDCGPYHNTRIQGKCYKIPWLKKKPLTTARPLTLQLKFDFDNVVEVYPGNYIIENEDIIEKKDIIKEEDKKVCTVHMEETPGETIVLGSMFLNTRNVLIINKDGKKKYTFLTPA